MNSSSHYWKCAIPQKYSQTRERDFARVHLNSMSTNYIHPGIAYPWNVRRLFSIFCLTLNWWSHLISSQFRNYVEIPIYLNTFWEWQLQLILINSVLIEVMIFDCDLWKRMFQGNKKLDTCNHNREKYLFLMGICVAICC